jgi:hypothetical protein
MGATVIDMPALEEVLHGPRGPVMRHLYTRCEEVLHVAKEKINRSDGPGPHLKDSGIVEDTLVAGVPGFLIAFESEHAGYYFMGTVAHEIRPRTANVLAFKWPRVGPGIFHFRRVSHPGTAPHPVLQEAAAEVFGVTGIF